MYFIVIIIVFMFCLKFLKSKCVKIILNKGYVSDYLIVFFNINVCYLIVR